MKKFISLMNAQSFYYLWYNPETKVYLERIISNIIGDDDHYELLDTFNDDNENLKSYIFLESNERIIYIDFNHQKKMKLNDEFLNFIKLSSNKKVIYIIFASFKGENNSINNTHYISQNENNILEIKLFLSNKLREQRKYDQFGILDFLNTLDDEFYCKYLNEERKHL